MYDALVDEESTDKKKYQQDEGILTSGLTSHSND
jgi:hypothetical protein